MKTDELIKALGRLKVQTGSLVCLGCGHEHNCGLHGCALLREAEKQLYALEHALRRTVSSGTRRSNSSNASPPARPARITSRPAKMTATAPPA